MGSIFQITATYSMFWLKIHHFDINRKAKNMLRRRYRYWLEILVSSTYLVSGSST